MYSAFTHRYRPPPPSPRRWRLASADGPTRQSRSCSVLRAGSSPNFSWFSVANVESPRSEYGNFTALLISLTSFDYSLVRNCVSSPGGFLAPRHSRIPGYPAPVILVLTIAIYFANSSCFIRVVSVDCLIDNSFDTLYYTEVKFSSSIANWCRHKYMV